MIIDKNVQKYIVFSEDSIIDALKKISDNKSGIVFSVTESGLLEGVVTDGDIRRWLVQQREIDLNQPVSTISNKQFKFARIGDEPEKIQRCFSDSIQYVPLLDSSHHLIAIASKVISGIKIGSYIIDQNSPVFIIAEIGNNHNGSLALAKKMIDQAIAAGADCVKFQMRHIGKLYHNAGDSNDASEDLGSQYVLDLLSRFQLETEELLEAFDYCKEKGVLPLCTPWDAESLEVLEKYGMEAYKVASADLTNHDLLTEMVKTGKPLFCSTGMSTEKEIIEAVALLKQLGAIYILLHCNSTYPAPFKDINLDYLARLKQIGDCLVGYSGHERGISVAIAAVAKGAKVVEKHFTLDKSMEGNDHKISLLPEEFASMVKGIREIELAIGTAAERRLSQGEIINRESLAKSLVINCGAHPGDVITAEMVEVKSPGRGLQPNRKQDLIGLRVKRDMMPGDFFFLTDLEREQIRPRNYSFKRPWGLPVRYHDFAIMVEKSNPDLIEFHLSYKDLEENLEQYFQRTYDLDFVVHSPELFRGDHVLDLCSRDVHYRQQSIRELQRVIDVTTSLKSFFPSTKRPLIVTNCGGFTSDMPLQSFQRGALYEILQESLAKLDDSNVEIIIQSMPPFPWHFGGQRYHNLFVDPEDTVEFCSKSGFRLCFDVSHSKLACNHYKWSFKEFVEQVGPYVAHLHLADAEGVDGEGFQIGEGSIDFPSLAEYLTKTCPQASFIPEIWQGHKNEGEGFWASLERLEKWF